jgi:hypothetical protein
LPLSQAADGRNDTVLIDGSNDVEAISIVSVSPDVPANVQSW